MLFSERTEICLQLDINAMLKRWLTIFFSLHLKFVLIIIKIYQSYKAILKVVYMNVYLHISMSIN